jgi:hypothetical protein
MIYWKYRVKIPEKSKVVAVWLTRWAASAGDPSLRLKNGSAQDDSRHVIDEVHHYQRKTLGAAASAPLKPEDGLTEPLAMTRAPSARPLFRGGWALGGRGDPCGVVRVARLPL